MANKNLMPLKEWLAEQNIESYSPAEIAELTGIPDITFSLFLMILAMRDARVDAMDVLMVTGEQDGFHINQKINMKDGSWMKLIHYAAINGYIEAVKWLLDNGAEVNDRDSHGSTPMHLAAWTGEVDVMKYLKECGADFYARNNGGQSPMDGAVFQEQTESIKCLKLWFEKG